MVKRPSKKILLALGASGALALGIAAPTAAFAADRDTTAVTSRRDGSQAGHQQQFSAALAKELGLDESKVSDALTKVREQLRGDASSDSGKDGKKDGRPTRADRTAELKTRLAEAVKAGTLTQAEADAITKAAAAGVLGGGHGGEAPSPAPSGSAE